MNKNLKKVISSVAALSMVASSVAALAADFPDVESTASYAQAVNELSALNVINGYEDGTFGPDKLVTRAEITKMIVDAVAEGSAAESAKGLNTKFADVTGEHWASGYITQGVANGFIAGMSDTEFAPDANVTFVQAQKMLVCAVGYDTYATAQGGWPSGYKSYASSLEITKGISGITDNTELTRAQVAQMIDNAMGAPLCIIESWNTEWNGSKVPVLDIKDGQGKGYQTLFTNKHKAYKVYGRVTETSKTGSLDVDKVNFQVEKADNFDDQYVSTSNTIDPEEMYIGTSKADDYLRTYSQALIQKNDDDEYTILTLTPAAANKSVTVAAEDIDDGKTNIASNLLYFYPAGTTRNSVKYEIADSTEYYVNGVSMGTFDQDAYENYILNNETAAVTLQKETNPGSTASSSKYNVIMISTYATAVVDEVVEKSTYTTINFTDYSAGISQNMRVENDDDTKTYNFTLDGEAIKAEDLLQDDVLNISYNASESFKDSDFYDVIVTRNTVEGVKCTGVNSDKTEFTIGGTKYKVAQGMNIVPETSTTYNLYLDHFGRIAAIDEDSTSKKLGVLKNVYTKANGDAIAEVITKEGTVEEYKVDDKNVEDYKKILEDNQDAPKTEKYPAQVIDYTVSTSTNKITIRKNGSDLVQASVKAEAEYKASSSKIGSIRLSDATLILDLSDVNTKDEYRVLSQDNLKDGNTYTAYGYDKSSSDSSYRFVIITEGTSGVNSTTQLAVFDGREIVTDGDDDRDAYNVLINGEEAQVMLDDDVTGDDDFQEGDLIVYATNASGYITEVINVFSDIDMLNSKGDYASFREFVFENSSDMLNKEDLGIDAAGESSILTDGNDEVNLVFGPVIDRTNKDITIGAIEADGNEYVTDLNKGATVVSLVDESKIYTYDYSVNSSKASRVSADYGMMVTPVTRFSHVDGDVNNDGIVLTHEDIVDSIVFAVARTIDDDIQEIYLIIAED